MPRPSNKPKKSDGGAEKREQKSSLKAAAVPKVPVEETAPSSPNKVLWTDMMDQEEADETVGQIKEELNDVMEGCLNAPTEQQLLAFSTLWAKSYLTEFVEGHILCLDGGEEPEEGCRTEDSEAVPTGSDPWLQGRTPVVTATPQHQTTLKQQVADGTQKEEQTAAQSTAEEQCEGATQLVYSSPQQQQKRSRSSPDGSSHVAVPCPHPPLKPKEKKLNLTSRRLPGPLLPPITTSTKREEVKVKNRMPMGPNSTTGSLHQLRTHRPIPKLDPSCLPQLCVFPQHAVFDNIQPSKCQKSSGRRSQLNKLGPVHKQQQERETSSRNLSGISLKRDKADQRLSYLSSSKFERGGERTAPSGPLSLEKMNLAEGVSLLDPDDKIYLQSKLPSLSTKLKPIQSEAAMPLYSVEKIIAGPPQVKPLIQPQN